MIPNEAVRPIREDLSYLKEEFRKYGYLESKGSFILSCTSMDGNQIEVSPEIISDWDPMWHAVNDEFEADLGSNPEWSHLSNKMFFVWDGNNRLRAFMSKIKEGKIFSSYLLYVSMGMFTRIGRVCLFFTYVHSSLFSSL